MDFTVYRGVRNSRVVLISGGWCKNEGTPLFTEVFSIQGLSSFHEGWGWNRGTTVMSSIQGLSSFQGVGVKMKGLHCLQRCSQFKGCPHLRGLV